MQIFGEWVVQGHDRPKKNMGFALVWLALVQEISKILQQVSLLSYNKIYEGVKLLFGVR